MIALRPLARPAVALAVVVGVHGSGGYGLADARLAPRSVATGSSGPVSSGPSVTLGRAEVAPGEAVVVSLNGFGRGAVTVAICGNQGRRGSGDCDMRSARSEGTGPPGRVVVTRLLARPPPTPCPCVVRASSTAIGDLAVAPIVVRGHPVARVVDPINGPLVAVSIGVERASHGLVERLRAALGGPTKYVVTVSVRNLTAGTITKLEIDGSARHRFDDDAATLELEKPPVLGPGRTWEQTVEVELPALAVGRLSWMAVASGAGVPVEAERATSNTPVALYLLGGVLVADIGAMVWRRRTRRRRSRQHQGRVARGQLAGVNT